MFGTGDDWRRLCEAGDMRTTRRQVVVRFANGRSHTVGVEDAGESYLLTAVVANAGVVGQWDDIEFEAWQKNRHSRLVGFRVDRDGRMLAQGWTPKVGLTPEAFQAVVRSVAREADRYEFHLTGADRQ